MTKRLLTAFFLTFILLTACSTSDGNENFIYERDPDVAGTVNTFLEKDMPFAALQEILFIDSSPDRIYDKSREDGTVEKCREEIYAKIKEKYTKSIEEGRYDDAFSVYFSLLALEKLSVIGNPSVEKLYLQAADADCAKENYVTALYRFSRYLSLTEPTEKVLIRYGDIAAAQNNRYVLSLISDRLPEGAKKREYRSLLEKVEKPDRLMQGTVTIWVNKGTKLQYGVGVPDRAIGSGFFIDKRGYLITNYHVIESEVNPEYEGFSRLFIRLPDSVGTKVPAKVVAWDPVFDIALLKTEMVPEYIFSFSLDNDFRLGDKIYAIGSPGGLENTITSGIVSAGKRKFLPIGDVLQVDVPVNPGNSGGPLVNEHNEVLGVVFAGIPRFQNINFVIPSHWVMDIMSSLYEEGKTEHSWLGLSMYEKNGIMEVVYAIPGEAANAAGLDNGDIIRKINGIEIHSITQVHKILNSLKPDTMLCVEWERNGAKEKSYIATRSRPQKALDIALKKDSRRNAMLPLFGICAESTGNYIFKQGYVIKKVYQGFPAYEADLSVNDPFALKDWRYNEKQRYVAMHIMVKKKKAGFMESGLQLVAFLDENNLI